MTQYAYIRVSTKEQKTDRQMDAFAPLALDAQNIFTDKLSGKNFNRPAYKKLMRRMKAGDTLFIASIDRLGRNYDEILEQWKYITKNIGADIVVLDMPLLNTREVPGNLTGRFVSALVLQILSYVAETEHAAIHQRQREGIRSAMARGVRFGRTRIQLPEEEFLRCCSMHAAGEMSAEEAGKRLGISYKTFLRRYHEYAAEKVSARDL